MENNKYNIFYSKKSVSELLQQILMHKITGSGIDKKWHDALILHLNERNLNEEERTLYSKILETPAEILKNDEQIYIKSIKGKDKVEIESSTTNLKLSEINKAGKSLKRVAYFGIYLIIISILGILISIASKDLDTIRYAYIFLGIGSFLFYLLILNSLYEAGDNLESVNF